MKSKQIMALLTAAALCLSGCAASGDSNGASSQEETAAETDSGAEETGEEAAAPEEGEADKKAENEAIVAAAEEDVVSYLTDGAYKSSDVLAEQGDYKLTAAEASFYIAYQYYNAVTYYERNGQTFSPDDPAADGMTAGEYMAKYARSQAVNYLAGRAQAAELGVILSEEDQAALDGFMEDNYHSYGESRWYSELGAGMVSEEDFDEAAKDQWILDKGRTMFAHSMLSMGTTPDDYKMYADKYYYIMALQDSLFGEGGEYSLTDEELDQMTAEYMEENGVVWGRCILFSTINATEEEAAKTKEQMESVYEELSALSGQELYDRFTVQQGTYDTSGYTAGEVQMYTNSDPLVPGYYETLSGLKEGELGVTDKTAYGWFILLREASQPSLLTDNVRATYINENFTDHLEAAAAAYGLDPDSILSDLDISLYFERLDALKEAVSAVDQVVSLHPASEMTDESGAGTDAETDAATTGKEQESND